MPHTSPGGQFLGFEMQRSRGKIKNKAEKGKSKAKLGKRKQNLQPHLILVDFLLKNWGNTEMFD